MEFVPNLGVFEVLILLALGGGPNMPNDLASFVLPDDYFTARKVTLNAKEMMTLASKEPADARTQIQQLLAIRWLGANREATTKGDRDLLEQIAAGKKANDPQGFARAHARRALARLDNKPLPSLAPKPSGNFKKEAFAWFPADMTLAAAVEAHAENEQADLAHLLENVLVRTLPPKERAGAYDVVDSIGNIRIDRASLAMLMDEQGEPQKLLIRITGAARTEDLIQLIPGISKGRIKPEKVKAPDGTTVTVAAIPGESGVVAFIGDNEVLLASDQTAIDKTKPRAPRKDREYLDEALAVRAGKAKALPEGRLANLLKDVPAEARLLALGVLPEASRKGFTAKNSPFRTAPQDLMFHAVGGKKLEVTVSAGFENKQGAEGFAESVLGLKQKDLKELENVPADVKIPPDLLKQTKELLGGVKASAERNRAVIRVSVDTVTVLKAVLSGLPVAPRKLD